MDKLASEFFKLEHLQREDFLQEHSKVIFDDLPSWHTAFKKQRDLHFKKSKRYIYMITYTIDPKKYPEVSDELIDEIEDYIKKQGQREALKVISYEYVREKHKNGRPHWHAVIETEKFLKKDRFNYYKKYGNFDLSKTKAQTAQEALNYISKDNLPTKVK